MGRISDVLSVRVRETNHVQEIVKKVFEHAARYNVDSAVIVRACAEVVAAVAATLDLNEYQSKAQRGTLDDQMDAFFEVVKERHPQIVHEMLASRSISVVKEQRGH